jgi:hypothetical protein
MFPKCMHMHAQFLSAYIFVNSKMHVCFPNVHDFQVHAFTCTILKRLHSSLMHAFACICMHLHAFACTVLNLHMHAQLLNACTIFNCIQLHSYVCTILKCIHISQMHAYACTVLKCMLGLQMHAYAFVHAYASRIQKGMHASWIYG